MPTHPSLQAELAELLVESLHLEIEPKEINPSAPLYQEGLGLDSIDLLELSVVISKRYGFQIKSDDPDISNIFSSLDSLTTTVEKRRTLV